MVVVCLTHHVPLTGTFIETPAVWPSPHPPSPMPFISLERALSLPSQQLNIPPAAAAIAQVIEKDTQ